MNRENSREDLQTNIILDPNLIFFDLDASSSTELFSIVGKKMIEEGYVREGFINALNDREKVYPTGLRTKKVHVAIPHTSTDFVKKPVIAVVKLKNPIEFVEMATDSDKVYPEIIFVLAIKTAQAQLDTLVKLMDVFVQEDKLMSIYNSQNEEELYKNTLKSIS